MGRRGPFCTPSSCEAAFPTAGGGHGSAAGAEGHAYHAAPAPVHPSRDVCQRPSEAELRRGGHCTGQVPHQVLEEAPGCGLGSAHRVLGPGPREVLPLADASDAKARERARGTPLPTSSRDASEAPDPSRKRPELPRAPSTPRITTFPPVPVTCDAVRNKCREMLTAALQTAHDHVAIGADCQRLSAQIEECIFRDVGNTDMKYKNRVRSRISNLKDAKNPDLRRNVLCGAITPQQIAVMTSEEMASDELKEIRKAMTKEAIREHQMARTGGTQTDLFTCGKCRKKNCTYTQVQTRSSDEPMTTFVVCNECGNRWKVGERAQAAPSTPFSGGGVSQPLWGLWCELGMALPSQPPGVLGMVGEDCSLG
ncbi:PREDICTED: transcription elongation factor A protein 2 isoform X4 [Cercocebus atys]|uniref:transcription elongation factor A protein 2 isoform X4 n=1 Tax=Cercocebus atys TaxID=9531 RepID=UPI0005F4D7DA|nr:PREDICTED: transcription elongation factor A protein 2 isoform X4 [Cercocebus atys]